MLLCNAGKQKKMATSLHGASRLWAFHCVIFFYQNSVLESGGP